VPLWFAEEQQVRYKLIAKKIKKDGSKISKSNRSNIFKKVLISLVFGPTVFIGAFSILNPKTAEASFLDFFGRITRAQSEVEEPQNKESLQTMQILEAPLMRDPKDSVIGDNVFIHEDSLIGEIGPSGSIANVYEESSTGEISVYVVREGDTLATVAKMFGVSTNTIKWSNDLKTNTLKVGTRLTILPVSGVTHTVQKGDTISSIAKKYNGDADEITEFNDLSTGKIAIGDKIIIPNGEITASAPSKVSVKTPVISTSKLPTHAGFYMLPAKGIRTRGVKPGHKGVDIANSVGTSIYASASGRVIVADDQGYNGGFGKYVVISHNNGTQTLYAHMSEVVTVVGSLVEQGDLIGKMGNTGKSTGPHLHFEVRGAKNPF
jgi:LysM repeat protein